MASKRKNGEWRTTYRSGERTHEITLPGEMSEKDVDKFEELARALVMERDFYVDLEPSVKRYKDNLPDGLRKKLVAHGLLPGKPDVLTLGGLIEYHRGIRAAMSEDSRSRDERLYRYLLECFGKDKPIDSFVKADAEKFRTFMLQRSKEKGEGTLEEPSVCKFIQQLKSLFTVAVDADFLIKSPFASVKAGHKINTKKQKYISGLTIHKAIQLIQDFALILFLAFPRFAGIRPCELRHLRYSNFEFYDNGAARFRILIGKTDKRFVPISAALRPVVDTLFATAGVNQDRVITNDNYILPEKYRKLTTSEVGTLLRRTLRKVGVECWVKIFINLRSSFITDTAGRGLVEKQKDCIIGNSEQVRLDYYLQLNMSDEDYAGLGERLLPKDWADWGAVKTPIKSPIDSPISSPFDMSFWGEFDDSTPNMEIALKLCEANGLPIDETRKMLEKDNRLNVFGNSVKSIRHSIYDYGQGKISHTQLTFRAFGFLGRAVYEFIREFVMTPFQPSLSTGARRT